MAFKLSKHIKLSSPDKPFEVVIPLSVNTMYEDDDPTVVSGEPVDVRHVMRMPETSEREKHQQMMVKVRGQNVKAQGNTEANFWLWKQCMLRLEGYDDLPETKEQIIKLFEDDPILHIHAENAAGGLLNYIGTSEGEITKK